MLVFLFFYLRNNYGLVSVVSNFNNLAKFYMIKGTIFDICEEYFKTSINDGLLKMALKESNKSTYIKEMWS